MISAPADYQAALRHSHESVLEVLAYEDGTLVGELPVNEMTLTLDATTDILRRADIHVAVDPLNTATRATLEALTTNAGSVVVKHGISYGSDVLVGGSKVTLATLRIEDLDWNLSKSTRIIRAYDRALLLQEHKLVTPRPLNNTYRNLITTMIQETLPGESVTFDAGVATTTTPAAGKSFSRGDNRLRRIQEMCEAIGGVLVNDPDGSFRVAEFLEAEDPISPAWTIDAGQDGVLVNAAGTFSRREQYNAVGIEFTPADPDGTWAGFVYLWDNDNTSPTYYDGPFGKRNIFFTEEYDHLPSSTEAEAVARRRLYEHTGRTRAIELEAIYNPLLVPQDRITVILPDGTEQHTIESLTLEFGKSAAMQVTTRLDRGPGSFGVSSG